MECYVGVPRPARFTTSDFFPEKTMRLLSFTLLAFVAGAAISAIFAPTRRLVSENSIALSESHVRDWVKKIPLNVTANVIGTSDRVVPTDETGDQLVKFAAGQTESVLVYVKAKLIYEIDLEPLREPVLQVDSQRKVAIITLPAPHLVEVGEHPEKIAFVSDESSREPTRITEEVMSSLQRLAGRGRYLEDAKALCASRIETAVLALGYTPNIVWSDAGLPSGGKRPL